MHSGKPFNEKLVFITACLGMLIFGVAMISLGTVSVDLQTRLGLEQKAVGALAALLPLGILLGSIIFGPVVDRYGYRLVLVISAGLVVVSLLAMVRIKSSGLVQLAFLVIGFGGGILNGGTNALVADISTTGKGARLSLLGAFYGIGALGLPLIVGFLSRYFSNTAIITGIGLSLILPVIFMLLVVFPEPKQKQGFPLRQALQVLRDPVLILLGLVLFFQSGMEGIVNNWSTSYLTKPVAEQGCGIGSARALYALTFLMLGITLARLFLGGILRRIRQERVFYFSLILVLIGYASLYWLGRPATILPIMFLIGVGFAAIFPIIYAYAGQLYTQLSGTAFSVILVLALTGNTVLNYVTGRVTGALGMRSYLLILTGAALIMGLIFSGLLPRLKHRMQ